jgi:hypothetical protein
MLSTFLSSFTIFADAPAEEAKSQEEDGVNKAGESKDDDTVVEVEVEEEEEEPEDVSHSHCLGGHAP